MIRSPAGRPRRVPGALPDPDRPAREVRSKRLQALGDAQPAGQAPRRRLGIRCERREVLIVVIQVDDLRPQPADTVGGGGRGHPLDRDVHRYEGDVDVRQRQQLRHALGHTREIHAPSSQRDQVAVGFALRMLRRARLDVVRRDRLDRHPGRGRPFTVRQHDAVGDLRSAVGGDDYRGARLPKLPDRLDVEVVSDIVGNEDEIRGLGARQVPDAPGIDVNHRPGVLDLDARVDDRRDHDVAPGGGKPVGSVERDRARKRGGCERR